MKVSPKELVLQKGQTQQLAATAVFSDGTEKDVTGDAIFRSLDTKAAVMEGNGKVKAGDFGETAIIVTYLRRSDTSAVTVPQPLPAEKSPDPFSPLRGLTHPGSPLTTDNKIDELVLAKLKKLGLPPSEVCSDEVFFRRVFLDVIGILPTAEEVRAFLAGKDAKKRSALIDQLLERDEFADFWALKWGDLLKIKSEYPSRLWPKGVQTYHQWVRDCIAQNKPYDQFVRELLVAKGSNFRNGPANFYRAVASKDPQSLADSTALVFMGARIGCARCHSHPVENWSLDDDLGLAAFFARVSYKPTSEWKEEIVYVNPKGVLRHPRTREVVKPKFPGGEVLDPEKLEDPRENFADWLVSPQNPWFTRNIANRVWFWLMGRGIIHEPDDLRPTNPPENAELLDYLQQELVSHKYDLKHLYRIILNSRTYQLSAKTDQWNEKDVAHFSHYHVKRLGAEQLLDAISQVTDTSERFTSTIPAPYTHLPAGFRATQLSDGNIVSPAAFLELFGRPPRDTCYENERCSEASLPQALYLVNSDHFEGKVARSERIKRLLESKKTDAEIVEEIYLATLSRSPAEKEKNTAMAHLVQDKNKRVEAVRDLVWAICNTKEFLYIH